MAERIDRLLSSQWTTRLMVALAVGTCMNFAGMGVALFLIRGQAAQGQIARDVQVQRQPIWEKVASDEWRRGVITGRELACFRDSAQCPAPKP
jgi:hypothetical protein